MFINDRRRSTFAGDAALIAIAADRERLPTGMLVTIGLVDQDRLRSQRQHC